MNFEQFLHMVIVKYETQSIKGDLRLGQIFFNELLIIRPAIAEKLRGSMIDPFFKERITQVVQDFVRNNW